MLTLLKSLTFYMSSTLTITLFYTTFKCRTRRRMQLHSSPVKNAFVSPHPVLIHVEGTAYLARERPLLRNHNQARNLAVKEAMGL